LDSLDQVDSSTAGAPGHLRLALAETADTVVIYRTTGVSGVFRPKRPRSPRSPQQNAPESSRATWT
jgi:hypothetical protein